MVTASYMIQIKYEVTVPFISANSFDGTYVGSQKLAFLRPLLKYGNFSRKSQTGG